MTDISRLDDRGAGAVGGGAASATLLANSFHADKIEYYRSLFEQLYRQPAAQRPLPPGVNTLIRLGVALGGLLSTSGGEHMLLSLTGQIDPSVTARDLQFASIALEQTGVDVSGLRDQWTREQKSVFLRAAAQIGEDLLDGTIDETVARAALQMLIEETNRRSSGSDSARLA